jgi:4'-phosphopantetheinyl transferase
VLAAGEVQVWWAHRRQLRPHHVALLDAGEQGRRDLLAHDADRHLFTLGCATVRTVLGSLLDVAPGAVRLDRTCPDCDRPHGRPVPRHAGDLDCSVSRSGDHVAVAVTRGVRVGVDVERVLPVPGLDRLVTQVLARTELAAWRRCPAPLRDFYTYWTRKEAVLKATGWGLRVAPDRLAVSAPGVPARVLAASGLPIAPDRVRLHDLRAPAGYAAAVAILGNAVTEVAERDAAPLLADAPVREHR